MDVAVKLSEVFSLNFAQMQEIMHMYCLLKFFISLSYVLPTHWNVSDTFSLMFLRRHIHHFGQFLTYVLMYCIHECIECKYVS